MGRGPKPAKPKVEPQPSASRKSPQNDAARVRDLEKRLTEALEQQTATANILRVISGAPAGLDLVLHAVLKIGTRLCEAQFANVFLYNGETFELAVTHGAPTAWELRLRHGGPLRFSPPFFRPHGPWRVLHVADLKTTAPYLGREPMWVHAADEGGVRTFLAVPLVKEGRLIGTLMIYRQDVRLFTDRQIGLLETFADQAAIAIENVRLFTELQEKNTALTQAHARVTESLEQQTATSEILSVISGSPTDIQPVLDAVAERAARLCNAFDALIYRLDGDRLRLVAHHGPIPAPGPIGEYTRPLGRGMVSGRVVLDGRTVHVADMRAEADEFPETAAQRIGSRTVLGVPLMREGIAIGAIILRRLEVQPFTDKQIHLVTTFADQAVIAIENVRLFNETKEALEQQAATSEILRVISSSPTDLEPVLRTIVHNARKVCGGYEASVFLREGNSLRLRARQGGSESVSPDLLGDLPVSPGFVNGRAILERRVVQVADLTQSDDFPEGRDRARQAGYRTNVAVPLMREGEAIGTLAIRRAVVAPFTDAQLALLQTFADQAVIAIENVRLFKELQEKNQALTAAHAQVSESLEQQTATSEILQVIASSPTDIQPVLDGLVQSAVRLCGAANVHLLLVRGDVLELAAAYGSYETARTRPMRRSLVAGRAVVDQRPVHVPDIELERDEFPEAGIGRPPGPPARTLLAVPLLREEISIGVIQAVRTEVRPFADPQIALLKTFADQAVIAIENVRLFKELEMANRGLEAASQHKSEFLANMSHELRTPLNAIIGFSEVLSDRMFGELNEKQEEYLKDINASGGHLLSLINDILDLSKIEAGRMELELTEFDLPTAIENALTLVRERAGRRSIALHTNIDNRLGQIQADERKVRQVVLNLLSNAIKFTPEGGRIEVAALPRDGFVEVSVSDTGIGIAPEDQEKVFEEFRQVGTAAKKVEGTGLGLTLCRKFVELHGGRIWVKSQEGVGSTFTFTIPADRTQSR